MQAEHKLVLQERQKQDDQLKKKRRNMNLSQGINNAKATLMQGIAQHNSQEKQLEEAKKTIMRLQHAAHPGGPLDSP